IQQEYILMRWKERFFVDEADYQHHRDRSLLQSQESGSSHHGLTISGFYYICMSRVDGSIQGFYCDAFSCPYQKLEL
ncbi:vacuolar import/degradation protein Vid24, partial [Dimargaris cristalligena]